MNTYEISHGTSYKYSEPVALCHNELRLRPLDLPYQRSIHSDITVTPLPAVRSERHDVFGNAVTFFSVQEPHKRLEIVSRSTVEVQHRMYPDPANTVAWENARHQVGQPITEADLESHPYILDSPFVARSPALANYALISFYPGRPVLEASLDLMTRIFTEFKYTPGATNLYTPLEKIMRTRKGVCQDFAHIMIGSLRSINLPARYVSGYIETTPAEGALIGADASHAWASVYVPHHGWIDFDPTNNHMPRDQHIVLAVGRDYGDITPIKGVSMGGGKQTLKVAVRVSRTNAAAPA